MSDTRVRAVGEEELGSIFHHDFEFEGEMSFTDPILIHGTLKGSLTSSSDVFVGEDASLDMDMEARRISIKGTARGTIKSRDRIELFRTARVDGTLDTPGLIIQSGARFNGPCIMPETPEGETSR